MNLKKSLRTGQSLIEYFIVFAAIGALVIIGTGSFFQQIKSAGFSLYDEATSIILE